MPSCSILTLFYSQICSNSFVKIMFNVPCIKKRFGLSFLLRHSQDFYLRYTIIHVTLLANTPGKVKIGSRFVIPLNPTQARLFTVYRSLAPPPFMI